MSRRPAGQRRVLRHLCRDIKRCHQPGLTAIQRCVDRACLHAMVTLHKQGMAESQIMDLQPLVARYGGMCGRKGAQQKGKTRS